MADQDTQAMAAQEKREAAKQDARTLAEAEVIRNNVKRFELAKQMAVEMSLESKDQADAFAFIAGGVLHYPKMEKERANKE